MARQLRGGRAARRRGGDGRDLFVVIRVRPHPAFTRRGADLERELPITLAEALLGRRYGVELGDDARPHPLDATVIFISGSVRGIQAILAGEIAFSAMGILSASFTLRWKQS